jgi:hypothetical protein
VIRHLATEQDGRSDDALDPDHPDLDRRAVRHSRQDRDDALFDEVDMRERRTLLMEHLFLREGNRTQPGKVLLQLGSRQRGEKPVFLTGSNCCWGHEARPFPFEREHAPLPTACPEDLRQ